VKTKKKKPQFDCDVNGGIMVTCAVRYALGRKTYVPSVIQEWIKTYWDNLNNNTKSVVVRDVFEYLYENYRARNDAQFLDIVSDYDASEWEKFGIDRYWALSYDERKMLDNHMKSNTLYADWLKYIEPKLYLYSCKKPSNEL
jgi:hypothetical protein